jgi:dihydroorotase
MRLLIRQARVIDPGNEFHSRRADLLIANGKISRISGTIRAKSDYRVIEAEDLFISRGWIDLQAAACDPGFEHKEDLESLMRCAAAGGFTAVCVHSATNPPLHTKAQIEYLIGKSKRGVCRIIPFGTVSQEGKGQDLSEMYDMKLSGAGAFSDYKKPLSDSGLLLRALQYADNIGSLIIAHCQDETISLKGQMNEGPVAVSLGLRGIPALAEELMVERNIRILEYSGGRLHIPCITSAGSIPLIRKAKAAGLKITCGVPVANLLLEDKELADFDTNYKLDPPLRAKQDVNALRQAVLNGTIDVIVSDHQPQDKESKELEFDLAESGMISLQTAFGCALKALGSDHVEEIVRAFSEAPRKILGQKTRLLREGDPADLTLFSTKGSFTLNAENNLSPSANSPFLDRKLPGRVVGIVRRDKSFFN